MTFLQDLSPGVMCFGMEMTRSEAITAHLARSPAVPMTQHLACLLTLSPSGFCAGYSPSSCGLCETVTTCGPHRRSGVRLHLGRSALLHIIWNSSQNCLAVCIRWIYNTHFILWVKKGEWVRKHPGQPRSKLGQASGLLWLPAGPPGLPRRTHGLHVGQESVESWALWKPPCEGRLSR